MDMKYGYIVLSLIMAFILVNFGINLINKTVEENKRKKIKTMLIGGLCLWFVYIFIVGESGILMSYELPPRFPLFLVLPVFVFIGVFLYKNRSHTWIDHVSLSFVTGFQSFRIAVESLFVTSVAAGVLTKIVTIEGYNYDMVFGYTALIVFMIYKMTREKSFKFLLAWNYLGLVVIASIIFLFTTTTYFPGVFGSSEPLMPLEFTTFPYVLVAGFLMPLAVFVHVLSILVLSRKMK